MIPRLSSESVWKNLTTEFSIIRTNYRCESPVKMYYELFAITRIHDPVAMSREASKVASTVGKLILNNRGLVRNITSLGPRPLPKIMTKDREQHFQGFHFVMGFDSSSAVQQELVRTLRRDPRILRCSVVKIDLAKKLNASTSYEKVFNSVSIS